MKWLDPGHPVLYTEYILSSQNYPLRCRRYKDKRGNTVSTICCVWTAHPVGASQPRISLGISTIDRYAPTANDGNARVVRQEERRSERKEEEERRDQIPLFSLPWLWSIIPDQTSETRELMGYLPLGDVLKLGGATFATMENHSTFWSSRDWRVQYFHKYPSGLIKVPIESRIIWNVPEHF